jgi:hypothetical protein
MNDQKILKKSIAITIKIQMDYSIGSKPDKSSCGLLTFPASSIKWDSSLTFYVIFDHSSYLKY